VKEYLAAQTTSTGAALSAGGHRQGAIYPAIFQSRTQSIVSALCRRYSSSVVFPSAPPSAITGGDSGDAGELAERPQGTGGAERYCSTSRTSGVPEMGPDLRRLENTASELASTDEVMPAASAAACACAFIRRRTSFGSNTCEPASQPASQPARPMISEGADCLRTCDLKCMGARAKQRGAPHILVGRALVARVRAPAARVVAWVGAAPTPAHATATASAHHATTPSSAPPSATGSTAAAATMHRRLSTSRAAACHRVEAGAHPRLRPCLVGPARQPFLRLSEVVPLLLHLRRELCVGHLRLRHQLRLVVLLRAVIQVIQVIEILDADVLRLPLSAVAVEDAGCRGALHRVKRHPTTAVDTAGATRGGTVTDAITTATREILQPDSSAQPWRSTPHCPCLLPCIRRVQEHAGARRAG
jgi:hypothetical protein